ncbi:MAG: MarR family transcriptional regulator [Gammaproteobacteria bacterium]|nr:MarR family transcriptional regulator [Gammaproteobacteria bacterium]
MRRIRRIDESQGIGRARLSALAVLHFGGSSSLTELARAELVTPTTMHHVIKGLLNDKLVRKIPDPADKRRQEIHLTIKGEKVIKKAHAARLAFLDSLLAGQPTRRIQETIALLEAMDQG